MFTELTLVHFVLTGFHKGGNRYTAIKGECASPPTKFTALCRSCGTKLTWNLTQTGEKYFCSVCSGLMFIAVRPGWSLGNGYNIYHKDCEGSEAWMDEVAHQCGKCLGTRNIRWVRSR